MSSSLRAPHTHRRDVEAVSSSHGRILLRSTRDQEVKELDDVYRFVVWDPITDKEWELPVLVSTPTGLDIDNWAAALVCAVGDGCSHLDCHFNIVFVGKSGEQMFSCFYSSEADSWSDPIFVSGGGFGYFMRASVLVGNTLYFRRLSSHVGAIIVKYDLSTHQMCIISLQCEVELDWGALLTATEDGRLGVAMTSNSTLSLWLREQGRLAESRVIQLDALLPDDALIAKPQVAAFAETGAGVIFLRTRVGYFTIDLNSGRSKKVGECPGSIYIVPYVSFCTPASGTVLGFEGPGASVVVSSDDEPGAGVAVSGDEGPGDVVVSKDEGPGPSMSSA